VRRHTQNMLYHLLPVVFWLLAVVGTLVPVILHFTLYTIHLSTNYYWGYLVVALVLFCIVFIGRIKRHSSSVEQCFQIAILLGIASYWLPTVLFLTLAFWAYLIYQNLFSFRSFLASVLGFALVAVWAAIFIFLGWITNPWTAFFATENAWGWIPTGAFLLAWFASTIARQILRVR